MASAYLTINTNTCVLAAIILAVGLTICGVAIACLTWTSTTAARSQLPDQQVDRRKHTLWIAQIVLVVGAETLIGAVALPPDQPCDKVDAGPANRLGPPACSTPPHHILADEESRSGSPPPPSQPHANPNPYIELWTAVYQQHRLVHNFFADGGNSRRSGRNSVRSSISLAVPSMTSDRPGHGEHLQLPITGPQDGDLGVTSDADILTWLSHIPTPGHVGPTPEHQVDRHLSDDETSIAADRSDEAQASTCATWP